MQSSGSLIGDIISSVTTILAHSKFADCNVNRLRQWGHMACSMPSRPCCHHDLAIIYLYGWEFLGIQAFGPFHFGEAPYPSPIHENACASQLDRFCSRHRDYSDQPVCAGRKSGFRLLL